MDLKDKEDIRKLINGCIKGKPKYQKILHQTFYSKMLAVCMRYAKNTAEAEDMLHEGFIKLYQILHKYNYQGSFEGWVRRIIINNSLDVLRKKKNFIINVNQDNEYLIDNYSPKNADTENLEQSQLKAEGIIKAIQQLSPAYKAVFNMYVLEDMSHKEIAEKLNISEGASKSNLFKAKLKIKELLGLS